MRKRRKADWFSIVATDLFCGALCAVIILDAVSQKAPSLIDGPGPLTLSFPVPASGCSSVLVIAVLDAATGEHVMSSQGAGTNGSLCVVDEDLPDLTSVRLRSIVLAKGTVDIDVRIADDKSFDVTCSTALLSC